MFRYCARQYGKYAADEPNLARLRLNEDRTTENYGIDRIKISYESNERDLNNWAPRESNNQKDFLLKYRL